MFSRKQSRRQESPVATKPGKANGLSFIGSEVVIGGDVSTTNQLHIEGRIDGHVRCAQLCQGHSGVVAGDIVAGEARLAGRVEGTVSAGTLIIEASARIAGDVTYETISIAAGAQIDGRLSRRDAPAAEKEAVARKASEKVQSASRKEASPAPEPEENPAELFAAAERRLAAG